MSRTMVGLAALLSICWISPSVAAPRATSLSSTQTTKKGKKARKNYINALLDKGAMGVSFGIRPPASIVYDGDNDHSFGTTVDMGLTGGAVYDKSFHDVLSYSVGAQYRMKGGGDADLKSKVEYKTIEVPAVLKARFPVNNKIMPYLQVGLFASVAFDTAAYYNGSKKKTEADKWSSIDYGMVFGLGSYFTLTKTIMASANLTYNYGLYNLISYDGWNTGETKGQIKDTDEMFSRGWLLNGAVHF
ncbi:PorT family protein [Myxococcota bacterium]|nr:PorT family protein [Myxococcota bacterium]MBU1900710.1 PorT family protein [Myxococcota bacterium]